jgi:hypothetical protein
MTAPEKLIGPDLKPPQDSEACKRTVLGWSYIIGFVWLLGFVHWVLSDLHRTRFLRGLEKANVPGGATPVLAALAGILVFLGIHVWEVHRTVWDRHVIKFRRAHNRLILRRLFAEFNSFLKHDYHETIEQHHESLLQQVFCRFIDGGATRLSPESVKGFYRAYTRYQISRIFEISLALFFLFAVLYAVIADDTLTMVMEWRALATVTAACVFLAIVNRFVAGQASKAMRKRTEGQIEEIVTDRRDELQQFAMAAATRFNMVRDDKKDVISGLTRRVTDELTVSPGDPSCAYVSSPRTALSPGEQYDENKLMLRLVAELTESCGFKQVFYSGARDGGGKQDVYSAIEWSIRHIRHAGVFIFHWPTRRPSSSLMELGYALALGRRVIILVRDRNELPYLIGGLLQRDRVSEHEYGAPADLIPFIIQHRREMFGPGEVMISSPTK